MKLVTYHFTMQIEDEIKERVLQTVLVPQSDIEVDFIHEWIRRELQDDLGGIDFYNSDIVQRFYRAWSRIRYADDGEFVFAPPTPSSQGIISFFVHPFVAHDDQDLSVPPNDFELLWEQGGIVYSLYEQSIIEDLMRAVK
jgi:hypothetical protein